MPANAVPFNGRGKAQLALKRPAGAIRDFSRAIVLSSRYGQAFVNRADALVALHRHTDAVKDYTAAIDFGIDTPQVYLGRAGASMR
jgi:tetratricopeptide (TPR) repeat protein